MAKPTVKNLETGKKGRTSFKELEEREEKVAAFFSILAKKGVVDSVNEGDQYSTIKLLPRGVLMVKSRYILARGDVLSEHKNVSPISEENAKYLMGADAALNLDECDMKDIETIAFATSEKVKTLKSRASIRDVVEAARHSHS